MAPRNRHQQLPSSPTTPTSSSGEADDAEDKYDRMYKLSLVDPILVPFTSKQEQRTLVPVRIRRGIVLTLAAATVAVIVTAFWAIITVHRNLLPDWGLSASTQSPIARERMTPVQSMSVVSIVPKVDGVSVRRDSGVKVEGQFDFDADIPSTVATQSESVVDGESDVRMNQEFYSAKEIHLIEEKAAAAISLLPRLDDANIVDEPELLKDGPSIAWLMSFPNSGTSYTIHLVREVSNTTTATNYGLEGDIKDRPSVPVYNSSRGRNGPFLELIINGYTNIPTRYIMTKTHCGGFCSDCRLHYYIETTRSFQKSCLSGWRGVSEKDGSVERIKLKAVQYHASKVKRAIHMIRNPLDNVVARFHLEHSRHKRLRDAKWLETYPSTVIGFQRWCKRIDAYSGDLISSRWVDHDLAVLMKDVPCHAEFYRYFQWHNSAFSMAHEMALPVLILHYEDYHVHFEETLSRLLNFLELPMVGHGTQFVAGKEYSDYYSKQQKKAISAMAKEMSSVETWAQLNGYYF